MSHKMPGPPIGPFASAYVDAASVSAIEDGSLANPYKTIQAALDAKPVPADALEESLPWQIMVAPGSYPEDLMIPAKGRILLGSRDGFFLLGDAGPPKGITWNPEVGDFGGEAALVLRNCTMTGSLTVTGAVGATVSMDFRDVGIDGNLTATVDVPANCQLDMDTCEIGGTINADLRIITENLDVTGATVCDEFTGVNVRCGDLTVTANATVIRGTISGNFTALIGNLDATAVSGTLTILASGQYIKNSYVTGNALVPALDHITNSRFGGTLTTTGDLKVMFGTQVTDLTTLANNGPQCHGCKFSGGVLVTDTASQFFNCTIFGDFDGPAGSMRFDGGTQSLSSAVVPVSGATLDPIFKGGGPALGGPTVVVDRNSTSSEQDGTWANPYKTIQAALDNAPVPADAYAALLGLTLLVQGGLYDEDLTIPRGRITIKGFGLVSLGAGVARNILWAAVTGHFVEGASLRIDNMIVTGNISGSGAVASGTIDLVLTDCFVIGDVDGSLFTDAPTTNATIKGCSLNNNLELVGNLTMSDGSVGGNVVVTTASPISKCNVSGDFTVNGAGDLSEVSISGLYTVSGGGGSQNFNSAFLDIDVAGADQLFFGCSILGNFTGPANSFRADGTTLARSSVTLLGGATLDSLVDDFSVLAEKTAYTDSDVLVLEDSLLGGTRKKAKLRALGTPLPLLFNGAGAQYAAMTANAGDAGWGSNTYLVLNDGVNTVYVQTVSAAGSNPTVSQYDTGGGVRFHYGLFSRVFTLNNQVTALDIKVRWKELDFFYNAAAGGPILDITPPVYLEHTGLTHNLITGWGLGSVVIATTTAADTVTIGTTVFAAVNGVPDPEAYEYQDVPASGSAIATAASLAVAINSPTPAAALVVDLGFAVVATVHPVDTDTVLLDSNGSHFALVESTGGARQVASQWDDIATALVITPGADLS